MPYEVLISASPSFNDSKLFERKLNHLLSRRSSIELHVLTQKVFTRMVTDFCKQLNYECKVYHGDFFNDGPQTTMILYEQILQHMQAVVIFWDGETTNEQRLIKLCQDSNIKHCVVHFESERQELKRAIAALKKEPKRKKITIPITKESKQRYYDAHHSWFEKKYPQAFKEGHYTKPTMAPINSGSRMDTFIVNFIVWSGWSATKINVMMKRGKQFIATGAKPGTFDLSATIKGRSVKLDSKHGADKASDKQLEMQQRERNAGAIAEFIPTIEAFFVLYDKIISGEI